MLDKSDEQRVCNLLTEAITMLCRNGLAYQRELSIEGLLGITLDKQSVVLVNIKQTINLEPELDCMPQVEDDVAERPVTPTYKSPRRTPDSSRSRSTKRRRCDISSSAQSEMPDTFDESVPTIVLDQEEEDEQVDAVEIKTEVIEKVECNDHSTAEPCMSQMNSQLSNRLADTSQYGGHVETDVSIDAGASWDFAGVAAMSNMNTSGYGGLCASQVTVLPAMAHSHSDLEVMRLVLWTPGPFQVVRTLHRRLQRRSTSGRLLSLLSAQEAAGLGQLDYVLVGSSPRRSTVFYKQIPDLPISPDANVDLTSALLQLGLTLEMYMSRMMQLDRLVAYASFMSIARVHPNLDMLTQAQVSCLYAACPSPEETTEQGNTDNESIRDTSGHLNKRQPCSGDVIIYNGVRCQSTNAPSILRNRHTNTTAACHYRRSDC